jgi:hypothetical protein
MRARLLGPRLSANVATPKRMTAPIVAIRGRHLPVLGLAQEEQQGCKSARNDLQYFRFTRSPWGT